jgi:ribosomal protein S18 acetylase RimI-like enzyme
MARVAVRYTIAGKHGASPEAGSVMEAYRQEDIQVLDSFTIRPARVEDKDAVLAFTATVWEGRDYIGSVWDEWLAADDGLLLAGELMGVMVACARLSSLGYGEGWFQGLRVAPEARGRGIARRMLEHCAELSRRRGDRTLRLMTEEENASMQRVMAATNFRLAFDGVWIEAPVESAESPLRALPPAALPCLMADLRNAATSGREAPLYSVGWRFLELKEARLAGHLARGEVVALPEGGAWAIVEPDEHLWLGYAHGDGSALGDLLRAVRRQPAVQPPQRVRALVPRESALARALTAAGYVDTGHGEQCYERRW